MSTFSERLKKLRTERDYSQQYLADRLGISKSSINMYERGEREPGFETLEAIADFFNVDMNYLLGKSTAPGSDVSSHYDHDPDIRRIERARKNMSDKDKERMMSLLTLSFEKYFSSDYEDTDTDE